MPGHSHGWTALGVAHARNRDKQRGLAAFQTALQLDPANAYAMRNAAAILAETAPADAIPLYEKAAEFLPEDQRTLFGYGACLLRLGRQEEADPILIKCISLRFERPALAVRSSKCRQATSGRAIQSGDDSIHY